MVGDFDGDGLPDLIKPIQFSLNHSPLWYYLPNSSNGFGSSASSWKFIGAYDLTQPWNSYLADINGDGKVAIVSWDSGTITPSPPSNHMRALFSGPNGGAVSTALTSLLSSNKTPGSVRYQFADVNGDGLPDAIEIPINGSASTTNPLNPPPSIRVWKNSGRGFLPPIPIFQQSTDKMGQSLDVLNGNGKPRDPGLRIVDFDGDGRADLLQMGNSCRGVGIGTTPDPVQRTLVTVQTANPDGTFATGVALSQSNGQGTVSIGTQTAEVDNSGTTCGGGYATSQVLDVNGDGLADLASQGVPIQ